MKNVLALILSFVMIFALAACGSSAQTTEPAATEAPAEEPVTEETASYSIAIVKQLDHASLDEIANAIAAEFDAIAAEKNVNIHYEIYSGQGEQSVLQQIGTQAIADQVDAIVPIATLAAQVMANAAADTQTPVVFAAISDPETAELTGIDYVTGTSDALNPPYIMDMMLAQNPDIQSVGLLYSLSEANSRTPIAEAKAYLDEKGISYVEATGNTNDEVIAAASSLVSEGVDAIFTPTDNRGRYPPLYRSGFLCPQRCLYHLRCQLHRSRHKNS